jgi:rhodanese-related sulfurtransferase
VSRRGALTLLFAKFVPGLNTVAAPIAGQVRIPFFTFAVYDLIGSLAWGGAWLFAGRFFGDIARKSSEFFAALGHFGVGLVLLAVFSLVIYRVLKRRQFLDELEGLRLEPRQLMEMIAEAERDGLDRPFIVDLRHPLDVLTDPLILPGALRIGPDELKQRREIIPNDRDIVLYCTCPSEETSAKVALELHRLGVHRVRPLRGGLQGWKDAGYPVDKIAFL